MAILKNQTAYPVTYNAVGATPETGVIPAHGSVNVQADGDIPWVEFGRLEGEMQSPVKVKNVGKNATVTLSVTVS